MSDERLEVNKVANEIHEQFMNATSFFDNLGEGGVGLRKEIKRCINFEEGRQWNMDADVEDFPKIVLNVIKQIGKVRKSGILQNEYGFLVTSNQHDQVRKQQDFLKHLHSSMRLRKKDLKVVNDTYKKGTGIMYFFWDAERRGFMSKSGGRLRAEVIDIRRFRVADPYIQELQDQEWVMYSTRETLESIYKKYKVKVHADGEDHNSDTENSVPVDKDEKEKANVYTKFYRNEEGQVHFVITSETKVLQKARPLNPFYGIDKTKEEPNTMSTMDEKNIDDKLEHEVFNLYPFASLVLEERDNCFYGIPGALEHLEAQKSINHHFSVYDKGVEDAVLGGYMHKKGALGDQELTTEAGQVLELETLPGEDIKSVLAPIPVNNLPTDTLNYSGNLMGVLKQTSGATNIAIGQSDYAGQSGKQTQALLERAKENSSDMALLFNEYKIDQAHIMFLFAKFFYDNEEFSIIEHGFENDEARAYVGDNKFNGNQFLDQEVLIDIKVGPAPSFSEFSSIELLGMMVQSGQAPFEVYLSSLPEGYVNNKKELLALAQNNSAKKIQELQGQLNKAQMIMGQMNEAYQKMQKDVKNIDTVINENERLKKMLAELAARGIDISQKSAQQTKETTEEMAKLLNIMNKPKDVEKA